MIAKTISQTVSKPMHNILKVLFVFSFLGLFTQAHAQQMSQYDSKMLRLAEILGSLHYIQNLCSRPNSQWRDRMNELIDAENPNATRRARLYAAFNDAFRAFATNYHTCTKAAVELNQQYIKEGSVLSNELLNHFGN